MFIYQKNEKDVYSLTEEVITIYLWK